VLQLFTSLGGLKGLKWNWNFGVKPKLKAAFSLLTTRGRLLSMYSLSKWYIWYDIPLFVPQWGHFKICKHCKQYNDQIKIIIIINNNKIVNMSLCLSLYLQVFFYTAWCHHLVLYGNLESNRPESRGYLTCIFYLNIIYWLNVIFSYVAIYLNIFKTIGLSAFGLEHKNSINKVNYYNFSSIMSSLWGPNDN